MKKVSVEISYCQQCPKCSRNIDRSYSCWSQQQCRNVGDGMEIPDWCPLPDDNSEALRAERDALHAILVESVAAVGGSALPESSVEFLSGLPSEIRLVIDRIRERIAELEKELVGVQSVELPKILDSKEPWTTWQCGDELEVVIDNPPLKRGEIVTVLALHRTDGDVILKGNPLAQYSHNTFRLVRRFDDVWITKCRDCGQFVDSDRWVSKRSSTGRLPLCQSCADKYDDPRFM